MTCREKMEIDNPYNIDGRYGGGCYGCPSDFGYLDKPERCPDGNPTINVEEACTKCWDREIPGTENNKNNKENETMKLKTKDELIKHIAELEDELTASKDNCDILRKELEEAKANLKKTTKYDEAAEETMAITNAFVNAGYSTDHAVQLTCAMITSAANMANSKPTINLGGLRL